MTTDDTRGSGNPAAYLDAVLSIWAEHHETSRCVVSGNSMAPVIQDGDHLVIRHGVEHLRVGDIVVFASRGRVVAHRLIRKRRVGRRAVEFVAKGDRNPTFDAPLLPADIIAKAIEVQGSDKRYCLTSARWVLANYLLATLSVTRIVASRVRTAAQRLVSAVRRRTRTVRQGVRR